MRRWGNGELADMRSKWACPPEPQTKERPCEHPEMAKNSEMRLSVLLLLLAGWGQTMAATDPKLLLIEQKLKGFSDGDYAPAVERLLAEFELSTGVGLKPGTLRKCGLKISSEAGLGLATPKPLIRALGTGLIKRARSMRQPGKAATPPAYWNTPGM